MGLLQLDSFDARAEHVGPKPLSDDWHAGYAAALAAAEAERKSADAVLRDRLMQTIADLRFDHAAARQDVLRGLAPFFRALSHRLFPSLGARVLAETIAAELEQLAATFSEARPTLTVSPANMEIVSLHLGEMPGLILASDDALSPSEAVISTRDRTIAIDGAAIEDAIDSALSALGDQTMHADQSESLHHA